MLQHPMGYLFAVGSIGLGIALIVVNLILYRGTKHRKFMLLCMAAVFQALAILVALEPQYDWLMSPFVVLVSLFSGLFALAQFRLRRHHLRMVRLIRGMVVVGVLVLLIGSFTPTNVSYGLMFAFCWIMTGLMFFVAFWCIRHNIVTARWFLISWLLIALWLSIFSIPLIFNTAVSLDANTIWSLIPMVWISHLMWFVCAISQYIAEKRDKIAKQQTQLSQFKVKETQHKQQFEDEIQLREDLEVKFQERNFELEVTLRELEEKNRELEEKNTQDALTGMRNRRFFDKKYVAESRRSRREQTQLSVVMVDIDHFKKINDNYGHLAGDDVIRFVGRTLMDSLKRPSDHACRYGGEEFALILPSTDKEGAIAVAETIRAKLSGASVETEAGEINITASCGVCTQVAYLDMPANEYIELADKALYQAKNAGRDRVIHFDDCSE